MKNKLKIAVCAIFVVIFSLLPMSVFAKTDNVSASDLIRIAKDSNPDMYSIDSSHSTAIFEDDNNYYLVVVSRVVMVLFLNVFVPALIRLIFKNIHFLN